MTSRPDRTGPGQQAGATAPTLQTWAAAGRPATALFYGRGATPAGRPRPATFSPDGCRVFDAVTREPISHYASPVRMWLAPDHRPEEATMTTTTTTTVTALPERPRQARNIREGYEVLTTDPEGGGLWAAVTATLELCAPIAVVSLTVDVGGAPTRLPGVRPADRIMSRRSAS